MHRPHFYALLRAFFKLHISHTSYPIFSLCLQYNTTYLHMTAAIVLDIMAVVFLTSAK